MSTGLFAQINKGAMALTGTIGLNGGKTENTSTDIPSSTTVTTFGQKRSGFAFVPAFSYFFTDRIEGGLALAITKSTTTNDFYPPNVPTAQKEQKIESPLNGVGIFGNYYFRNDRNFACYGGIQFGVGSGNGKTTTTLVNGTSTTTDNKTNLSTFGFNTGLLFFVRENLAFNSNFGLISFNTTKTESTTGDNRTNSTASNWVVGVNGVIVNIGLKYFIGKTGGMTPPPPPSAPF